MTDGSTKTAFPLLMCSRTPIEYVADMYRLYADCHDEGAVCATTRNGEMELKVNRLIDPKKWLATETAFPCIKFYKTLKECGNTSLEIFVSRPKNSTKYYALGECNERGKLLFVSENNDTKLCWKTIDMLLKTSVHYCHRPVICKTNWEMKK